MRHVVDPGMLRLLRRGVESGLWTLENLDTPSPGFVQCTAVDRDGVTSAVTTLSARATTDGAQEGGSTGSSKRQVLTAV